MGGGEEVLMSMVESLWRSRIAVKSGTKTALMREMMSIVDK